MARRKREAEEARKAEVWNQRPKSPGPRVGVTVPQPFSFEQRVLPWQVGAASGRSWLAGCMGAARVAACFP